MSDRMTEREIRVSDMHDKTKVSGLPALWLDGQPETLVVDARTLEERSVESANSAQGTLVRICG